MSLKKVLFTTGLYILTAGSGDAQVPNIALNKPVIVSSAHPAHPGSHMTDGRVSRQSVWQSGVTRPPHIAEIDLKKYYAVSEIRVHSGIPEHEKKDDEKTQAAGFWSVKNFRLQYWDDANWTDFPNAEVQENRLTTTMFTFQPAITTFRIRLVSDDGEAISIMEIEAFGKEATDMPPPPTAAPGIITRPGHAGPQQAAITVTNRHVGNTMKYVGYNQGYFFPGSNVSGWLEYAAVNSLRIWASMNAFVPEKAVQVYPDIASVDEFDQRKQQLRNNPEKNRFIRWDQLLPLYDRPDSSSTNAMVFSYAITEAKRLGMDVILQMGSRDFHDNWPNKWKQWQRYYALAYYAAKTADVAMFAMQNEPNHRHSGPMKLDQWIMGMQITSDAIHAAVADVNKKYGKKLDAKFVGPVTAGQNTDWWAAVAAAARTDYRGNRTDKDLVNIFSTHSYNSPAAGYASRINNIRKIITDNHPTGQALPIVYTEIGRWMNAYLIDKEETMDSPSLFTEWAGIYSNNMKNNGYGMWAFKFANTASGTYPRGIKSGHHFTWQGKRIVEDAYQNLALHKSVTASSGQSGSAAVTDGDKSDASVWTSAEDDELKWVEIDLGAARSLGSAVVYTGSSGGIYTGPDRVKNFTLQYENNGAWKDIPGATEKECRYTQVFSIFKDPVHTRKIRFVSTDKGSLKVREIKVFAADDGPSDVPDYNISGIQRTGQVVRLFAKGFKDERPLLETRVSVTDSDLDSYTSYDAQSGNYYIWLVQRGLSDYHLSINLEALSIVTGTPIVAETVSPSHYGEVTAMVPLASDKTVPFTLPAQSVVLLTIPSGKLKKHELPAAQGATVFGGDVPGMKKQKDQPLSVQLDAGQPNNNKVTYLHFDLSAADLQQARQVVFQVHGKTADEDDRPFRLHVYGIPSGPWEGKQLTWNNALLLDEREALIKEVGRKAFVAGELAFTSEGAYHALDVTNLVKKHAGNGMTFVLIRETRQLGDDEDKGRQVHISPVESTIPPRMMIWSTE